MIHGIYVDIPGLEVTDYMTVKLPKRNHLSVNDTVTIGAYLQGQVGVLLFLAHLQTRQVRVLQLQTILLPEVLRYGAFNCLTTLKLQRKPVNLK